MDFIGSFKTIRIAVTRYRDRAVTSPSIYPEMLPQAEEDKSFTVS